ncbi:MAG: ATP-binding protein, partial [Actinomycetota bacterium]
RRNAESLVALAGAQTPRQWSRPIEIDNAVRGAFGEVEGYERIEITSLAPIKVHGSVVADITHLIAELLENALNFSDATTPVLVSGQQEGARYDIFIVDQGIGMSPNELAEYNHRITEPPPLERVPTRFLGLYVVGRLAERHGITVRLSDAPNRGVLAKIELPTAILDLDPALVDGPLRAEGEEEQSPLEEEHDLDAELQTMMADDGADLDADPGDDTTPQAEATPTAEAAPPAEGPSDDQLPTRADAPSAETAAERLPTRGATSTQSAPTPTDDLPTRGTTTTEPAPADDLPTRGSATSTQSAPAPAADLPTRGATTTEPAPAADLPTRGSAKAEPSPTDDLPTRGTTTSTQSEPAPAADLPTRGATTTEPTPTADLPTRGQAPGGGEAERRPSPSSDHSEVPEALRPPSERSGLDKRGTTDHSERSAGDFSSMMSALSSGINRGLSEAGTTDDNQESAD